MIRRNTASQTIYLPQLVLAADGAAVTSGATLTVAKDGTEAASAGTLAHVANGVWKYTPTQEETDAAIVGLVLTATNAVPVVLNLVTTAADTSAVAFGANTTAPDNTAIQAIDSRLPASPAAVSDVQVTVNPTELSSGSVDAIRSGLSTLTAQQVWDYVITGSTSAATAVTNLITRIVGTLAAGTHQPQTGDSFARLGAPVGASIAADIAAIDGGASLTGPWTRTITVTDSVSGNPIQNATVRFFRTGETESQSTNASGVATFTVEAATWSYAIVANGYAGVSGTVVVSADGDTAVGLVASAVDATYPPGSPGL